jgi:Cu+-exporting ATPase
MHAEVSSDEPGRCPRCGMALAPREGAQTHDEEHPHDR